MDDTSPQQCHLLRLASETLHNICDILDYDRSRKELANLRLTCRALQFIPEEYFFRYIKLGSGFDSLMRLQRVSQHERIRGHVNSIRIEVNLIYPVMTRNQYDETIHTYSNIAAKPTGESGEHGGESHLDNGQAEGESSEEDHSSDDGDDDDDDDDDIDDDAENGYTNEYSRLLAEERDSLSDEEIDRRWDYYQERLGQENKLKQRTFDEIVNILAPSFALLPNLWRFTCTARSMPQLRFNSEGDVVLHPAQRRTLLGPLEHHTPVAGYDEFVLRYTSACVTSLLRSDAMLFSLSLESVPWDVLLDTAEEWFLAGLTGSLAHLARLELCLRAERRLNDADLAQGLATMSNIVDVAIDLEKLEWLTVSGRDITPNIFKLPRPYCLNASSKLRKLNLGGQISFTLEEFCSFIDDLPKTIRSLKLEYLRLINGRWVDIFKFLREQLSLDKFRLNTLVERDQTTQEAYCWIALESRASPNLLLAQLTDYVTRKISIPPLTPTTAGGTTKMWESKCDDSILYCKV
jgi:hypothetical protein